MLHRLTHDNPFRSLASVLLALTRSEVTSSDTPRPNGRGPIEAAPSNWASTSIGTTTARLKAGSGGRSSVLAGIERRLEYGLHSGQNGRSYTRPHGRAASRAASGWDRHGRAFLGLRRLRTGHGWFGLVTHRSSTMRSTYLVCYDICDDKRLRRVFKVMRDFGDHLQPH